MSNDEKPVASASDLHEAILANSYPVVKFYLEQGVDPNRSPQLAPIGVISATEQEQARDLHRTLGRVFRSRQSGTINPLIVAVCNAYHHSGRNSGRQSLQIVRALLKARADTKATCNGIAFCAVGNHPSVTIASPKTAATVALFLKRFPLSNKESACSLMMDSIATVILENEHEASLLSSSLKLKQRESSPAAQISSVSRQVVNLWKGILENKDSSFSDLVFVCPDGQVKAHKCVLVAATPYFRAALHGPWKENVSPANNNEWKTSNSVHIMKAVLKFIYTGQLSDHHDNGTHEENNDHHYWSKLLSVASEYQLEALLYLCEERLTKTLNSSKSCKEALCLAELHDLSKLKSACWDYVEENSTTVLLDPNFVALAQENEALWNELAIVLAEKQRKRRRLEDRSKDMEILPLPLSSPSANHQRYKRRRLLLNSGSH